MAAAADCAECLAGKTVLTEPQVDHAAGISEHLSRSGRFEETFEWRIGTEMTSGIERIRGGHRVWASTEGTWEAFVAAEDQALAAYYVLGGLQQSLFYAIGWASRASASERLDGGRNACERYLARLWREGRDRARAIADEAAVAIEHGDAWGRGISRLRAVAEPYPDPDDPVRHTWFEAQTNSPGLRFASASPTVARAAEFMVVHEGLASDIPDELGWEVPGSDQAEEQP